MKNNVDRAQLIIETLADLSLQEQIAMLTSLLFSHVMASCQMAGLPLSEADLVLERVIESLPSLWRNAKLTIQHGSLPN